MSIFEKMFRADPKNEEDNYSQRFDQLTEELDRGSAALKTKENALSYIKELKQKFDSQTEKERNDEKEGGSILILQTVKRVMRQFELSELEVNDLVESDWLEFDRTG